MAANFEPVAEALLGVVENLGDVAWSGRLRMGIEQLPDQPAVIVALTGATAQPEHNLPTTWTGTFRVAYMARADGSEESPETRLNAWLVLLQDALAANPTLDGTCEHAWITGEVDFVPPTTGEPWMECWASVEVQLIA